MNFRPVIISSLALSLAGSSLVVWTYLRPGIQPALVTATPSRIPVVRTYPVPTQEPVIQSPQQAASPGADAETTLSSEIVFSGLPVSGPITQQELLQRAAIVEQEANHDLKHLVSLLDLDQTQQDQIFDTLVRRAPAWHPAMQVDGNTPATKPVTPEAPLLDDIEEVLTPDQQQELAENELNRAEWWAEVIDQLLPTPDLLVIEQPGPETHSSFKPGTAAAAAPPPPEETRPAASKDAEGAVIFAD